MNVLILGGGGREHALSHSISRSSHYDQLYIAPGNAGTSQLGQNVSIDIMDFDAVASLVSERDIQMIVVGPEAPLVAGIVDYFAEHHQQIQVIGPDQNGAQLEGSKAFAKEFMSEYDIPTADYIEVTASTLQSGLDHIASSQGPYVLKADGLAAGKGVLIIDDAAEAQSELTAMIEGKFGAASERVVIEQFLDGIEFSVFALTDGEDYVLLPIAKDYKRIGEGDTGPNTGGMGAVSPVPFVTEEVRQKVIDRIVDPTIQGIKNRGMQYRGFVFFGLILVGDDPYVIEYNCRMGDPETEVVLPRLKTDLMETLIATCDGRLGDVEMTFDERTAATVMTVSGGYPGSYEKGKVITGLDEIKDSIVYHAGTHEIEGQIVTNGGRVIALTSYGDDVVSAVNKSLKSAKCVHFDGVYYRKDIGQDL